MMVSMTTWKTTWMLEVSVAVVKWWYTSLSAAALSEMKVAAMKRAAASTSQSAPVGGVVGRV